MNAAKTTPRQPESFRADWLALREPVDALARDPALAQAFLSGLGARALVAEFGAGTASLLRYLLPQLRGNIDWLALDADPQLWISARDQLAAFGRRSGITPALLSPTSLSFTRAELNLNLHWQQQNLALVLPSPPFNVIVASAWTDLVSADWIMHFVRWAQQTKVNTLYWTLAVDGQLAFTPTDPLDAALTQAFHADMRRDKGFGLALGPDSQTVVRPILELAGYTVHTATSDWRLSAACPALTKQWLIGFVAAAVAARPELADAANLWLAQRRNQLISDELTIIVGHYDMLAQR